MKQKYFIILFALFGFIGIKGAYSQSAKDIRINEVLIFNNSNYEDNYGSRGAWIELFNSAYNKVNVAGCYLTDDINNPKKYRIPKNDPNTIIPTRFFAVFWADNKTSHGTFHLNFILDSTSKYLAIYDADGKTLIDSITLPAMLSDVSYGRISDGDAQWCVLDKTTPMSTNFTGETISAGQRFAESDPEGFGMAVVAMSVVFSALVMLYLIFRTIGKLNVRSQKKKQRAHAPEGAIIHEEISGEVFAAISTALFLYETEQHDYESAILTINRVAKNYSPWSSKIYGLRNLLHK